MMRIGRLLAHHGADLHGAGVRAQHHAARSSLPCARAHVERVVLLPRRMLGRDVELGEVEIVGLDVGPFGDGKAHVAEDLGHLVPHLADGMDAPVLQRPEPHGQRDVGLLGGETRRQRAAAPGRPCGLRAPADALLETVDRLPEGLALLGRHLAERRHQLGDAPLLAERADAHLLRARADRPRRRSRRGACVSSAARSVLSPLCRSSVCHPGPVRGCSAPRAGTQQSRCPAPHVLGPGYVAARTFRDDALRRLLDLGGRLVAERLEARCILDGDVGQHLAVDLDAGLVRGRR